MNEAKRVIRPAASPLCLVAAALALSGCMDHTRIQNSYVDERNDCQRVAERNVQQYIDAGRPEDPRATNAKLVTLFSDCMFERGWTVATPEREAAPAGVLSAGANLGVGVGSAPPPDRIGAARRQPAGPQQAPPGQPPQSPQAPQAAPPAASGQPPAVIPGGPADTRQPAPSQQRRMPQLNEDIMRRQQQTGGRQTPPDPRAATGPPPAVPPVPQSAPPPGCRQVRVQDPQTGELSVRMLCE